MNVSWRIRVGLSSTKRISCGLMIRMLSFGKDWYRYGDEGSSDIASSKVITAFVGIWLTEQNSENLNLTIVGVHFHCETFSIGMILISFVGMFLATYDRNVSV